MDYVIVDSEHFDPGGERLADACRIGRIANFPVLLRPARTDPESIRIAMDLGPCGLLLPSIESAEQLDGVRQGAYMPPRGLRRPGGPGVRWVTQFDYQTFKEQVEDDLIVIPQVESLQGLQNAPAIAAHPITTALGVGPYDLSAGMGLCWQPDHPDFKAALRKLRDAARQASKSIWMMGDPDELMREGYRFLCIGEPSNMLLGAMTGAVSKIRAQDAKSASRPAVSVNVSAKASAPYSEEVEAEPAGNGRPVRSH